MTLELFLPPATPWDMGFGEREEVLDTVQLLALVGEWGGRDGAERVRPLFSSAAFGVISPTLNKSFPSLGGVEGVSP